MDVRLNDLVRPGGQAVLSWQSGGCWTHRSSTVVFVGKRDVAIVKPGQGPWEVGGAFVLTLEESDGQWQCRATLQQTTATALVLKVEDKGNRREYGRTGPCRRAKLVQEASFQVLPPRSPTAGELAVAMHSIPTQPCVIVDLSETGLLMRSAVPLKVGVYLAVHLTLPGGASLRLWGTVVRHGLDGYGVAFGRIATSDRLRIADFVTDVTP